MYVWRALDQPSARHLKRDEPPFAATPPHDLIENRHQRQKDSGESHSARDSLEQGSSGGGSPVQGSGEVEVETSEEEGEEESGEEDKGGGGRGEEESEDEEDVVCLGSQVTEERGQSAGAQVQGRVMAPRPVGPVKGHARAAQADQREETGRGKRVRWPTAKAQKESPSRGGECSDISNGSGSPAPKRAKGKGECGSSPAPENTNREEGQSVRGPNPGGKGPVCEDKGRGKGRPACLSEQMVVDAKAQARMEIQVRGFRMTVMPWVLGVAATREVHIL